MAERLLLTKAGNPTPCSVLREFEEWGLRSVDLVSPPRRLWGDQENTEVIVEEGLDVRRLNRVVLPAELFDGLPESDNWQSMSRRSLARLHAYFLAIEDPQRRLDQREGDRKST